MGKVGFWLGRGIFGFRVDRNGFLSRGGFLREYGLLSVLGLLRRRGFLSNLFLFSGLQLSRRQIRVWCLHGAGRGEGFGKLLMVLLKQFEDAQRLDIVGGVSGSSEIAGGELVGLASGVQAAIMGV